MTKSVPHEGLNITNLKNNNNNNSYKLLARKIKTIIYSDFNNKKTLKGSLIVICNKTLIIVLIFNKYNAFNLLITRVEFNKYKLKL